MERFFAKLGHSEEPVYVRNIQGNLESHTHVQGKTHAQKIFERTLNFHLRVIPKLNTSLDKSWNTPVESQSAKTGRGGDSVCCLAPGIQGISVKTLAKHRIRTDFSNHNTQVVQTLKIVKVTKQIDFYSFQ